MVFLMLLKHLMLFQGHSNLKLEFGSTTANYFNGLQSSLHKVSLQIGEGFFSVNEMDGTRIKEIEYKNIARIYKVNEGFKIELKTSDPSQPAESFTFQESTFFLHVRKVWLKKGSPIRATFHAIQELPLPKRAAILLSSIVATFVLFYFFMIHLYLIVPIEYDTYLGKKVEKQLNSMFETYDSDTILTSFLDSTTALLHLPSDRFDIDITIINHPIVNAMALPGGKVVISTGLLAQSESPEEIAGIIAHEIAHAQERHSVQQLIRSIGFTFMTAVVIGSVVEGVELFESIELISEITTNLLHLKYSRGFERTADLEAVERLQSAHISVKGIHSFFTRLESQSIDNKDDQKKSEEVSDVDSSSSAKKVNPLAILSTHPATVERMAYLKEFLEKETLEDSKTELIDQELWNQIVLRTKEAEPSKKIWEFWK